MTAFILNQWVPSDGCACAGGNANAPVNTSLPVISGNPVVGQILTCSAGVWDGIPTTFLYQWQRDGISISGATHPTYTLVLADGLHAILCVVSAINSFGATSTPSTAVSVPYPLPVNMSPPAVTGTAKVDATLTCWEGAWDNSPTSFTFQWQRNGTVSVGSGSTYVPIDVDDGQSIRCIVTASNPAGGVSAPSNAVAITRFVPTNTTAPIVTGLPFAGQTFTCTQGTWTNFPTTFAYQWQRDGTAISGATSSTYICAVADQGHALGCAVTASNSGGAGAAANSNAIAIMVPFIFPGTPTALYSTRNVGSGYAGKCVNVRRTTDDATQDIGFGLGNNFDVAAAQSFMGIGSLYVTKFYDQSGNGHDAVQATAGTQPQLIIANGQAWLSFGENGATSSLYLTVAGSLSSAAMTVGYMAHVGSDLCMIPVNDLGSGWFTEFNNQGSGTSLTAGNRPGSFNFYAGGATADTSNLFPQSPNRVAVTVSGGAMQTYVNGVATNSAAGATITPTANGFQIGGFGATFPFEGLLTEVYVYPSVSVPNLTAISANQATYWQAFSFPTPYIAGTHIVQFGYNEQIVLGNVLNYERTQPWTAWVDAQLYNNPLSNGSVFFTNVPGGGTTSFPGYEFWVDSFGQLRIRVINNIASLANALGVVCATNVIDCQKHRFVATYDGSSKASGALIYIDGVPQTMFVESDTLTGSIIAAGQSLYVGNQQGAPNLNLRGTMGLFQLDNVVRLPAYIAAHSTPASAPPIDGNTALSFHFTDATGTTITDASGNGLNGTLTRASMRIS